ncbi:hypothetical protein N0V90_003993 [Kalmusia sp. IMI 367209]|nr:hypothetical protein N0V90_003993 [Kalmusia sp. IMI 367209]
MAVNFLSSSAANLAGYDIGAHQAFCSFNGFMTQFFVVQRCWFGSDTTRLLVNFVPRWLIILIMLGLYARLYRLIYRAHEQFMSFQEETSPHTHSIAPETESMSSTRRIGRPSVSMHVASKGSTMEVDHGSSGASGLTHARYPSPILKKLAKQMMMYPLAYMLIWTIPTSIRIYQSVTHTPAPFGIATVDKACIVIQGFADAVIYGLNESSKSVWRNKFRRSPPTTPAPESIFVNVEHEIRVERVPTNCTLSDTISDPVV